ncbi:hypothetical protein VTI28DRAFT_7723 [Corynascus sepedonium]
MSIPQDQVGENIPPAQKARTIAHMNADHRADMRHILLHYGAVPPVPPSYFSSTGDWGDEGNDRDPLMLDIGLDSFTVRLPSSESEGPRAGDGGNSSGSVHVVAFDPPLRSWAERRERLVEMTRAARDALPSSSAGAGTIAVNEYMAPRVPYDLAIFLAVLFYYLSFALVRAGLVAPGSLAARGLEAARFPGGPAGFQWLVDTIIVPVLGIHIAETWWLERSRLRRFGVRRGSQVWWLWIGSVFIEGAMAFKRFDIIVERLKRDDKKKQ